MIIIVIIIIITVISIITTTITLTISIIRCCCCCLLLLLLLCLLLLLDVDLVASSLVVGHAAGCRVGHHANSSKECMAVDASPAIDYTPDWVPIAFRLRSDCVPAAFRLGSNCYPIAFRLRSDCVPIGFRMRSDWVPTAFRRGSPVSRREHKALNPRMPILTPRFHDFCMMFSFARTVHVRCVTESVYIHIHIHISLSLYIYIYIYVPNFLISLNCSVYSVLQIIES